MAVKICSLTSLVIILLSPNVINFDSEIFHSNKGKQYENDYGDYYSDEIYGHEYGSHNYKDDDEYDYGIGNHKVIQKTLNKKGKNKMTPK